MAKEKVTKPTYVYEDTHKVAKAFAGLKGLDIPEAYDLLVTEGLKALHVEFPKS